MAPRTPLLRPKAYYERFDSPSLEIAVLAVGANAVALVAVLWWFLTAVAARVEGPSAGLGDAMGAVVPSVLVSVVLGWLLLAAILHLVVRYAGGDGDVWTTLAVVGETNLVSLAMMPGMVAVFYLLLGDVPADPEAAAAFFERTLGRSQVEFHAVSLVTTVWSAVILGYGFEAGHDLAGGTAFAIAAGYAVINLVFLLA